MTSITPGEYKIESGSRTCHECGRQFEPAEEYVSGVIEVETTDEHPHGLARHDFCPDHWPGDDARPWVAFWRTRVPVPEEPTKKRIVIDDDRLLDVFFRLDGTTDPLKLDLRYVIGLMLLRKRRLKLEGTKRKSGQAVMRVRKTRSKELHDLVDRRLGDEAVLAVSDEIGTLLDLAESDDLPEEPDDAP